MNPLVFDASAMLALGAGNQFVSRLVHRAGTDADLRLAAPALSLLDAERERAGMAEHVGMLDVLDIAELGFDAVAWCGPYLRAGVAAGVAHAAYLAQPSLEWIGGRPVITREPGDYQDFPNVSAVLLP